MHYLFPEIRTIEGQLPAEKIICIASLGTLLNLPNVVLFVLFYVWMCAFNVYITHRKAISAIVSGLEPPALQTTAVVLKLPSTILITSFRTTMFYLFRFQNILCLHFFQYCDYKYKYFIVIKIEWISFIWNPPLLCTSYVVPFNSLYILRNKIA